MAKKLYCPNCLRLVNYKEQRVGEATGYVCIKCGGFIWVKEGVVWKYGVKEPEGGVAN